MPTGTGSRSQRIDFPLFPNGNRNHWRMPIHRHGLDGEKRRPRENVPGVISLAAAGPVAEHRPYLGHVSDGIAFSPPQARAAQRDGPSYKRDVLAVGCQDGQLRNRLADRIGHYVGIHLSARRLDKARWRPEASSLSSLVAKRAIGVELG